MISEPFKAKEVKHLALSKSHDRWNILKAVGFNTYRIGSEHVTFDMVATGLSAWSQDQKAAYQLGDEAYAGSRNYARLQQVAAEVLGIDRLIPTHNGIGAEKLLATTLLDHGQTVLHNRGRQEGLVPTCGGSSVDITVDRARHFQDPIHFGGNVDLDALDKHLSDSVNRRRAGKVAYVHLTTCPDGWNGQPLSLSNLEATKDIAARHDVPVVLDISDGLLAALWSLRAGQGTGKPVDVFRQMVALADVVLLDAAHDCRSDVGGFITATDDTRFERLRNQVVVFEGLHSYGGMSGRAMAVLSQGIEELRRTEYTEWHDHQITLLHTELRDAGVPVYRGAKGVALPVDAFLEHLGPEDNPKFALAAVLYLQGGIRPRLQGRHHWHKHGEGRRLLALELPRLAMTCDQIKEVAARIGDVWALRHTIQPLRATHEGDYADEAVFEPRKQRLFLGASAQDARPARLFEPHKIAIFEPVQVADQQTRLAAMERAGYNTFLLDSEDIYIDLLTDSGTTAMSSNQWQGMAGTHDTPYSSRQFHDLVHACREALGFAHCIPTHQGRAAEHIMSQVMIKPGQVVPGNMYFTTTKLHQEMAGGVFADVIVDEAYDPHSEMPWKGNIDVRKLDDLRDRVGADGIAYVSFEMSVNMAGGQPFSMDNAREVSAWCQKHGVPLMFDATRCVENARMIQMKSPSYQHVPVRDIVREMMSYGDGCTVSCKKDFMVNMGGLLCCNSAELAHRFRAMLRDWEGEVTTGGMDPKDMEAMRIGLGESLDDAYIAARVEQTQRLGRKLAQAGIPIVTPPGTHAIFVNAREFLPHVDQDDYPAQALAAAIYITTGVRTMERGNVSKGRNPETGENYRPPLELVRLTIPRRVYTNAHFDFVVEGLRGLWKHRANITGLQMVYEPKVLRFFQSRFKPKGEWNLCLEASDG